MTEKSMYEQMAEHIGHGHSKYIPQIFEALASDDEAKLLLQARKPAVIKDLARGIGLSEEVVEQMALNLFQKGLMFRSKKPEGTRYYAVRNVMQFHDASIIVDNPPPEMIELWKKYDDEEWATYFDQLCDHFPAPPTRIVPIDQSIESRTQILPFDDITKAVDDATTLAVTKCSCRVVHGECGHPVEVCIQIDKAADYSLERGTGRKITREEAVEMLKMCSEKGLVHNVSNSKSIGKTICNCCGDCCENWPGGTKFFAPSRYMAVVDPDQCSLCEECIDRCIFNAITMEGPDGSALVNQEKCMGCGVCKTGCPDESISLSIVRDETHIPN